MNYLSYGLLAETRHVSHSLSQSHQAPGCINWVQTSHQNSAWVIWFVLTLISAIYALAQVRPNQIKNKINKSIGTRKIEFSFRNTNPSFEQFDVTFYLRNSFEFENLTECCGLWIRAILMALSITLHACNKHSRTIDVRKDIWRVQ